MNNIIILQHQKTLCFSPFNLTVQSGHQFCPKSENLVFKARQFLSLNILSYLHFFCLLKQESAIKKTETFSLKDPSFAWEFFACPHFKSDIRKDNRRSHVKLDNILFYFFKKEKMK